MPSAVRRRRAVAAAVAVVRSSTSSAAPAGRDEAFAAQFHGRAAPALVGTLLQAEGHGLDPVARRDAGERLDHAGGGLGAVAVAQDRSVAPGGPERGGGGQFGELVVGVADGVAEHPVHRALAAEDREQPFGEPLVGPRRAVRLEAPGPLRRYGLGPALVAAAGGPRAVHAHAHRPVNRARKYRAVTCAGDLLRGRSATPQGAPASGQGLGTIHLSGLRAMGRKGDRGGDGASRVDVGPRLPKPERGRSPRILKASPTTKAACHARVRPPDPLRSRSGTRVR